MTKQGSKSEAPLSEVMLAMDVVDTLRHREDLVVRELSGEKREAKLISRLRDVYHQQGIEVPDRILKEGVAALAQDRFVYEPNQGGLGRSLAQIYVSRSTWGKPILALMLIIILGLGSYFFAYLPYQENQRARAQIELNEVLPAQMEALRQSIFDETKVQAAVVQADEILNRGLRDAKEGNRAGADKAVADLTNLRDTLRHDYRLRVVNRENELSVFWTFPDVNQDATNYYIVVEAVQDDGVILTLPVLNEEIGEIDMVDKWGLRVSKSIYESIREDKLNDGIIQNNMIGRKVEGFLDVSYVIPVSGGAVTSW